eukprot:scaffold41124_cov54-Attheya_sp.AAC.4
MWLVLVVQILEFLLQSGGWLSSSPLFSTPSLSDQVSNGLPQCSCGSSPGRFIALRDIAPELSPLFHAEFIASSILVSAWPKSLISSDSPARD